MEKFQNHVDNSDYNNTNYYTKDPNTGAIYSKDMKKLVYVPNEIEKFTIPNGVEVVDLNCFAKCEKLKQIYFPKGILKISDSHEEISNNQLLLFANPINFGSNCSFSDIIKNLGDFTLFKEEGQMEPFFVFGKISAPKIEQKFKISNLYAFNKIMKDNPELTGSMFFNLLNIKLSKLKKQPNIKNDNIDRYFINAHIICEDDNIPYKEFAKIDETTNYGKILVPKENNIKYNIFRFPKGIEEIGENAFCGKMGKGIWIDLDSFCVTDLKHIRANAFSSCSFQTLDLSECKNLKTIGDSAFEGFTIEGGFLYMADFKLPDSLESIGHKAFFSKKISSANNFIPFSFDDICLPENLSMFYQDSFNPGVHLHIHPDSKYLYKDEKTGHIYSRDKKTPLWRNGLYVPAVDDITISRALYGRIEPENLLETKSLKAVDLSNSKIESIEEVSFYNNNELEEIKFCESLKEIKSEAFYGCAIEELDFSMCNNLESVGTYAFNMSEGTNVCLPKNLAVFHPSSFGYDTYVHIADDSKYLTQDKDTGAILSKDGKKLFWVPKDITNYTIPDSVEELDVDVFCFREKLEKLSVSPNIKQINAFSTYINSRIEEEEFLQALSERNDELYIRKFLGDNDYEDESCKNIDEFEIVRKEENVTMNIFDNTPLNYVSQIPNTDKTKPVPLVEAIKQLGRFTICKPEGDNERQTFYLGDQQNPKTNRTDFQNMRILANLKQENPDKSLKELSTNIKDLRFLNNRKSKVYTELEL